MSISVTAKRSASVIPLEYEIHPEQSVLIFDFEWENLVDFLEDPAAYLAAAEGKWGKGDNDARWTLRTPCLARIEPLGTTQIPIDFLLSAAGEEDLRANFLDSSESAFVRQIHRLWGSSDSAISKGFFMVNYAPGTGMLTVTYLPPFKSTSGPRYSKGYTTPTVVRYGNSSRGSLHIDMASHKGQSAFTRRDRAERLVDFLENPDWLANALNDHVENRCFGGYLVNFQLQREGNALTEAEPLVRQPLRFSAYLADREDPDYLRRMPSLVVEDPGCELAGSTMQMEEFPEPSGPFTQEPVQVWIHPTAEDKLYPIPPNGVVVCGNYFVSFEPLVR